MRQSIVRTQQFVLGCIYLGNPYLLRKLTGANQAMNLT